MNSLSIKSVDYLHDKRTQARKRQTFGFAFKNKKFIPYAYTMYILIRLKSEILIISIIHEHEYKHDFFRHEEINEETR